MPEVFYRASDGSEHPTPDEAERRDAILAANEAMREAERQLLIALAETAVTADGVVLKEARDMDLWTIGRRRDRVGHGVYAPCLQKIQSPMYWGNRHGLRIDDGEVSIVYEVHHNKRNETTVHHVRVSEVYASEKKARVALGDELAEWLVWQVQDFGRTLTGPKAELVKGVVRAVGDTREPNPVTVAMDDLKGFRPDDHPVGVVRAHAESILVGVLRDLGASELVTYYERLAKLWTGSDSCPACGGHVNRR